MKLAEIEDGLCFCIVDSARPRLHSSSVQPPFWLHWTSDQRLGSIAAACLAAKMWWAADCWAPQGRSPSIARLSVEEHKMFWTHIVGTQGWFHRSCRVGHSPARFLPTPLSRVLAMPASAISSAHHLACGIGASCKSSASRAPPSRPASSSKGSLAH